MTAHPGPLIPDRHDLASWVRLIDARLAASPQPIPADAATDLIRDMITAGGSVTETQAIPGPKVRVLTLGDITVSRVTDSPLTLLRAWQSAARGKLRTINGKDHT